MISVQSIWRAVGLFWVACALNAENWPSWRGPNGTQVSGEKEFPLKWSRDENVLWRTPLPEPGNSSPIVWGDKIFVTQSVDDGRNRTLMCLDRKTGEVLWQKGVAWDKPDERHDTNPHCSASPVTDGRCVVASFASAGIVAYDLDGEKLWHTDLGPQKHLWGQGSSPILHGDQVIVYHGPGPDSALYALDKHTGKVRWKTEIPEEHPKERFDGFAGQSEGMLGSFSTPLLVHYKGRDEIVLPAGNQLRAFAVGSGRPLWHCEGMNPLVYTSATFGEGTLVAMGGYFGSVIFARPGGNGDVTKTHRTHYEQRARKHRIGSPIIKDGHVYTSNTPGVAECIELATGKVIWEERLPALGPKGETWGSPVLAGDRLYVVNQSGDTIVFRAAPKFEVLAQNPIGEMCNSTLALSDGQIFLRTQEAIYCIAESQAPAAR
jgi:outer membrane protein assembly factor BamB